jgi:hypothetical protein
VSGEVFSSKVEVHPCHFVSVLYQMWSASLLDWPKQELSRYVKDQCFAVEKPRFWDITFI